MINNVLNGASDILMFLSIAKCSCCSLYYKNNSKKWHDFRGYLFVDTATIKQVIVGLKNWQCNKILRDRELVSRITDQDNVYEE